MGGCLSLPGTVFWITGLSGAGKTTVATHLQESLREHGIKALLLDGDELRAAVAEDLGYLPEDRLRAAMRYARLCKLLSDQGAIVICPTISMFHECRKWNRTHIDRYLEVYLKVPYAELLGRDAKGLYAKSSQGDTEHLVGLNGAFEEPASPDLVVDNHGQTSTQDAVTAILNLYFLTCGTT